MGNSGHNKRTEAILKEAADPSGRQSPLAMDASTFRTLGHRLVDQVAEFLESVPRRPVTHDESPSAVRDALDLNGPLPERGTEPGPLLEATARLLFDHSLFNGHPRFFGYVTAPPAPIGILGDFLAAAVNPNVGAWMLSPAATEIESQTVRWIAELIGYPVDCGGLLVSGGNMANFVCFLAARAAKADWNVREEGITGDSRRRLRVYGSAETHTWIQKAADLQVSAQLPSAGYQRTQISAWTSPRCAAKSTPTLRRGISHSSSWAPLARSAPALSIRCLTLRPCAKPAIYGSTWTVPTVASQWPRRRHLTTCVR